jgi:phage repressor protein C with HTH and peptisase S24 domain
VKLGDRVKQAREHAKLTQKDLAHNVCVSQTTIYKLESGASSSSRRTVAIAMSCNVNPIWLETGQGKMVLPGSQMMGNNRDQNSDDDELDQSLPWENYYPLVVWPEIPEFCEEDATIFTAKVPDDTMEPEFQEGEVLLISPRSNAKHNDFIIVGTKIGSAPVFKQLIVQCSDRYLKPLNPRYPLELVESELHVYGVVIGKYKSFLAN